MKTVISRPLGYCASQVDSRNTGSREQNLLSLSYGNIVRKDIAGSDGLLPESFATYNVVEPGDTVLRLTDLQNDQRSLRVGFVQERGIITSAYVTLRPQHDVDPRFFSYVLKSMDFRKDFYALGAGVRQSLKFDELKRVQIHLPAFNKQRAIAAYLDRETARIDALITKKQRMIELLKERRIAMVDSIILSATGYIRPIAALATYINGWPFKPSDFSASGIPVVRITQLTRSSDEQDYFDGLLPERVTLRDGDLVFSWSGSLEVRRWDRGHAYLNQHLFRVLPKDGVDVNWLTHALDCASRLFAEHMHGSTMTHITQPMMKMVRIPVPEVSVQTRIAAELNSAIQVLQTLHNAVGRQIDLLHERRQALISAAVTGEVDVVGVAA